MAITRLGKRYGICICRLQGCEIEFKTNDNRNRHESQVHGKRLYFCKFLQCSRGPTNGFARKEGCIDHLRRIHKMSRISLQCCTSRAGGSWMQRKYYGHKATKPLTSLRNPVGREQPRKPRALRTVYHSYFESRINLAPPALGSCFDLRYRPGRQPGMYKRTTIATRLAVTFRTYFNIRNLIR